jgi:hypothetical protein
MKIETKVNLEKLKCTHFGYLNPMLYIGFRKGLRNVGGKHKKTKQNDNFMTGLKNIIGIIFGFLLISSCKQSTYNINEIVISDCLNKELIKTIDHIDSSCSNVKSVLIEFDKSNNDLNFTITGDFIYYDSKAMDGFFVYKDKYVSVYGLKGNDDNSFINLSKLQKIKIKGLVDYDYSQLERFDKDNPPLPPPPPREPYYRKYLIINKDSFKLIDYYKY